MFINVLRHALRGCLLIALLLGACTTPAVERSGPEPVKLKVALMPYLGLAPFLLAEEEGYYAEQGLEVEFIEVSGTAEALAVLTKGDLDVAAGQITINTLNAMARGSSIKYVADKGYLDPAGCTYTAILARRSLMEAGELDSPSQLRGR
ncbi:MAG: ABC transporter substrate-binding protein, partial [Anaerolineae bacterium]